MRPLKIEFEGTDGAGKTTGLEYFVKKLRQNGLKVVTTREVGNPHIKACLELRKLVLDPENHLSGEAMELIFAAMRFENEKWFNSLKDVDIVVSDRGWLSHLAYTDHNVSESFTHDLYIRLMKKYTLIPDAVIYFEVSSKTALERRAKRGLGIDVIEGKGIEFQDKVRESFDKYINLYNVYNLEPKDEVESTFVVYNVNADQTLANVLKQLDTIAKDYE